MQNTSHPYWRKASSQGPKPESVIGKGEWNKNKIIKIKPDGLISGDINKAKFKAAEEYAKENGKK